MLEKNRVAERADLALELHAMRQMMAELNDRLKPLGQSCETTMRAPCPTCQAAAGEHCVGVLRRNGKRRERQTLHRERFFAHSQG